MLLLLFGFCGEKFVTLKGYVPGLILLPAQLLKELRQRYVQSGSDLFNTFKSCVLLATFELAEMSGCHPTYIGQLERGEKNATLESIEKIAAALNVSLSKLFEKLGGQEAETRDIPLECYEFLSAKTKEEQEHLYRILLEMDKYKRN